MKKSRRRAGFLVFILSLELLLCTLGTWQLFRWEEKKARIQAVAVKSQSPPLPLEQLEDDPCLEFQAVSLKGSFLHLHEKILQPRTFEGKSGVHLVTPFQLSDGRIILVDRGWNSLSTVPSVRRPRHPITLEGILYVVRPPGFFAPPNDPQKDLWYVLDPPNIFSFLSFKTLYIVAVKEDGWAAAPRALSPLFRNNHLEYAFTWYALAACIFLLFLFSKRRPF